MLKVARAMQSAPELTSCMAHNVGDMDPFQQGSMVLGPMDDLELMDLQVEHAAMDEQVTMFDDGTHPKPPHPKEEAMTDRMGERSVDMMLDTPPVENTLETDLTERDLMRLD